MAEFNPLAYVINSSFSYLKIQIQFIRFWKHRFRIRFAALIDVGRFLLR
jgi:hypothetical protein